MRCPNQSCDGVNKWCRCYKEHSNAYTQSKPGREHRFKINSFACHSECKVQLKNAPWWSRKMPPPPVSPTDPIIELCPARFVLFSVLQPPTFVGCFQHKARVGEPNNEGLSHLGVPKDVYHSSKFRCVVIRTDPFS